MSTVAKQPFELRGADGGPLRGEVRTAGSGSDRPAVIICHGFKGFKEWGFFPHLADRLARAGLTVISFNFSGSGVGPDGERFSEPERFGHATLSNDLSDLQLVVAALQEGALSDGLAKQDGYGLFGHSRGGGTTIIHAASTDSVKAMVTWAAIATPLRWDDATVTRWRSEGRIDVVNQRTGDVLPLYTDFLDDLSARGHELDIARAAARVRGKWLIVHGAEDEAVPYGDAMKLHAAAQPTVSQLTVIPGAGHTFGARHPWTGCTTELDAAFEATVGWFSDNLL
jgi:dienelactone hydrolase